MASEREEMVATGRQKIECSIRGRGGQLEKLPWKWGRGWLEYGQETEKRRWSVRSRKVAVQGRTWGEGLLCSAFLGEGTHVAPTSRTLLLSSLYTQHRALCRAHGTCSVNICDLLNTCQVQSKDSGQDWIGHARD